MVMRLLLELIFFFGEFIFCFLNSTDFSSHLHVRQVQFDYDFTNTKNKHDSS